MGEGILSVRVQAGSQEVKIKAISEARQFGIVATSRSATFSLIVKLEVVEKGSRTIRKSIRNRESSIQSKLGHNSHLRRSAFNLTARKENKVNA